MDVSVGDGLLGRVIDPLGNPLDGKGSIAAEKRLPVEEEARDCRLIRTSIWRSLPGHGRKQKRPGPIRRC